MMHFLKVLVICVIGAPAVAESVIVRNTIRAHSIISVDDVHIGESTAVGSVKDLAEVVGMEARVILYSGRPILRSEISKPAIVDRNEIVDLILSTGSFKMTTSGRVLGRAAVGERVKVMNISSKNILVGTVLKDGSVAVDMN